MLRQPEKNTRKREAVRDPVGGKNELDPSATIVDFESAFRGVVIY